MDLEKLLPSFIAAFGPVGALGVIIAFVIGYFYRRDFLRERKNGDRMLQVVEKNAAAQEKLSSGIERLGECIEHGDSLRAQQFSILLELTRRDRAS